MIETAQRAGLSLDEIRLLLEATPADQAATERLRQVAEQKLPVLHEAIERGDRLPLARGRGALSLPDA